MTCILENQCIQMKCEEQDNLDRLKIAMYGAREGVQKSAEEQAAQMMNKTRQFLNPPGCSKLRKGSTLEREKGDYNDVSIQLDKLQIGTQMQDHHIDTVNFNTGVTTPNYPARAFKRGKNATVSNHLNSTDFD